MNKPVINSYRITDQIFAGEYPGDKNEDVAKGKLRGFSTFGITHFIDLTEDGELIPYCTLLPSSIEHIRFAIRDTDVPESIESVRKLIKHIWAIVDADSRNKIYIHCWGGVGRTGTIVGCLLAEMYGYNYEETLYQLNVLFQDCPKSSYRITPENDSQRHFISRYIRKDEIKEPSCDFYEFATKLADKLKRKLTKWHCRDYLTLFEWIWLQKGKFPFECDLPEFQVSPMYRPFLMNFGYKDKRANTLSVKFMDLNPLPLIKEMESYRSQWESKKSNSTARQRVEDEIEKKMWNRIMDATSYVWGG